MPYSPKARAEDLIAAGRIVLAAAWLVAVWIDPGAPVAHVSFARTASLVLAVYLGFAVLAAFLQWVWRTPRSAVIAHAVDVVAAACLMFFTESPRFVTLFVFVIAGATLRWQWRGTLWTALVTFGIYLSLGLYSSRAGAEPRSEFSGFLLRAVYLAVVAVLLAYLGAHERRMRTELTWLAQWPQRLSADPGRLFADVLERVAQIFGVRRMLMIWDGPGPGEAHLASLIDGRFEWGPRPPDRFHPLVAAPLAATSFFCPQVGTARPIVLRADTESPGPLGEMPLHPELVRRYDVGAALALRFSAGDCEGWLLVLDKRRMTSDDLTLGVVVANKVAATLEHFYLVKRLQAAAAAEERGRLARDLHDGVVQTLSGTVFELEVLRRRLPEESEARAGLLEIQLLIVAQLRELRSLIRPLKAAELEPPVKETELRTRLGELAQRIERQWACPVDAALDGWESPVSEAMAYQICHLVNEALVNAARHAGPSRLRLEVTSSGGDAAITVADDGHGFPFQGSYDLKALNQLSLGPLTLRHRVHSLGGDLSIDSTPTGSTLRILLPLAGAEG